MNEWTKYCSLYTMEYYLTIKTMKYWSVHFSCSVVSNSLQPHESQHARTPCPSLSPRAHSNPHPLSRWCHPAISSSVIPFSSCPQSLPASESFPVSQLFAWGGQSTGVILPKDARRMDKKAVVHIHKGICLGHKKESIWVSSNEVGEPRTYYTEWSESERERQYCILTHIYGI